MKNTVILLIMALMVVHSNFAQSNINKISKDSRGKAMLLGKVNEKGLQTAPFNSWYQPNYKNYNANKAVVKALQNALSEDHEITVYFGSWCGDSKRDLPKFMNIMKATKFDSKNINIIAFDRKKQSPQKTEKDLNIHRVPTFIVRKNGKEIGRIVEHPKETLERDLLKIVKGERYRPNYVVAQYIGGALQQYGLDSLQQQKEALAKSMIEYTKGSRELNTMGYVYHHAGKTKEALFILELNTLLFPHNINTFDSLAEILYRQKQNDKAIANYAKVLALDPKNKNAKAMLQKIWTE